MSVSVPCLEHSKGSALSTLSTCENSHSTCRKIALFWHLTYAIIIYVLVLLSSRGPYMSRNVYINTSRRSIWRYNSLQNPFYSAFIICFWTGCNYLTPKRKLKFSGFIKEGLNLNHIIFIFMRLKLVKLAWTQKYK